MEMSQKFKNEGPNKTNKPVRIAAETIIDGTRVSEMTADELIEAIKQIGLELHRRNPSSQ
jgi:hypothetical protein